MKIPSGRPRSTKRLSIAEQAAERVKRAKPAGTDTVFEERETSVVQHIASKHGHRGRGSNPFLP